MSMGLAYTGSDAKSANPATKSRVPMSGQADANKNAWKPLTARVRFK